LLFARHNFLAYGFRGALYSFRSHVQIRQQWRQAKIAKPF